MLRACLLPTFLLLGAGVLQAEEVTDLAVQFINLTSEGKYVEAVGSFDATMQKALPAAKLEEVWQGVLRTYGRLESTHDARIEAKGSYEIVFVPCKFERGGLDAKIVFDKEHRIAGLFFVPSGKYRSPSYVDTGKFTEREVRFGRFPWSTNGTLSLPKTDGPHAVVVLVHGSGPHDRDETIGPNKPFRDLAGGLASRGIAVLRYEKRTKAHPLAMAILGNRVTVKEETIDDVVAAVEFLRSLPEVDRKRVYVLGHSLGGMLIPRIARRSEHAAGFISLAGSTRPLEDLVLEQVAYILSLDGELSDDDRTSIDELNVKVDLVKSDKLDDTTNSSELPLGIPAPYWLDLRGYNPATDAKEIERPLLILQGERDYQVTMADFHRWKESLRGMASVKLVTYPTLNHLFMEGEGKSSPAEYNEPGNVAEQVVCDIAAWISMQKD